MVSNAGRKPLFSEEQLKRLQRAVAHGASFRDLSSRYGCSRSTLEKLLKQMKQKEKQS
jgi:transposase